MSKRATKRAEIERAGFIVVYQLRAEDGSYCKGFRVRCEQCAALSINGHPSHERGCPNEPFECRECGVMLAAREMCDCLRAVEDEAGEDPPDSDAIRARGWERWQVQGGVR